ncbi:MAG TPA: 50S ribosomal protein L11 methyltransferase [Thermoanaerobaculia bacterium]|nr:50S ribosomal protein L11 methyltransferase [Thermoanaerobaculia bacterium]
MSFRKLSNATVISLLRFHRSLLADEARTGAYRAAIDATVKPGDVVIDIGCGSGILSFFACRAGARRVYAIDEGPVIELARELARENGFADRITFLRKTSYDATIDEQADVIITETMGNNGLDEGITGILLDARRWLRPGGAFLPRSLALVAAPVEQAQDEFWRERRFDLDFARVATHLANAFHPLDIDPQSLLSESRTMASVDFQNIDRANVRGHASFEAARRGTVAGLAVWFRAELAPGITIENAPGGALPSWKQSFFPIETPLDVDAGAAIDAHVETHDGIEWRWSISANGTRVEQTTLRSFPPLRG